MRKPSKLSPGSGGVDRPAARDRPARMPSWSGAGRRDDVDHQRGDVVAGRRPRAPPRPSLRRRLRRELRAPSICRDRAWRESVPWTPSLVSSRRSCAASSIVAWSSRSSASMPSARIQHVAQVRLRAGRGPRSGRSAGRRESARRGCRRHGRRCALPAAQRQGGEGRRASAMSGRSRPCACSQRL